jgi:hypothetical protein
MVWEIESNEILENDLEVQGIFKMPQGVFQGKVSTRRSPSRKLKTQKETLMQLAKRLGFATLVLATVVLLTACPSQTTISRINADPARYRNKEVAIVGVVRDSYGVMGNGAYEIDDGTGRLWVVTRRGVPSRGSRVGARGRVYNGFQFGGRNFGTVLEETDRSVKER